MKVFCIIPESAYTDGCALVAANDATEALKLIQSFDDRLDFFNVSCRADEVKSVYYEYSEPCVIFNRIYIE